jgi:hypothetical protein
LVACTVNVYDVPGSRPSTTALVVPGPTSTVLPPGDAVTVYPVSGALPVSDGRFQDTDAWAAPACATTPVGAPGTRLVLLFGTAGLPDGLPDPLGLADALPLGVGDVLPLAFGEALGLLDALGPGPGAGLAVGLAAEKWVVWIPINRPASSYARPSTRPVDAGRVVAASRPATSYVKLHVAGALPNVPPDSVTVASRLSLSYVAPMCAPSGYVRSVMLPRSSYP